MFSFLWKWYWPHQDSSSSIVFLWPWARLPSSSSYVITMSNAIFLWTMSEPPPCAYSGGWVLYVSRQDGFRKYDDWHNQHHFQEQDKMNLVESLNWNGGMTDPKGSKVNIIGWTRLFLESPCCSTVRQERVSIWSTFPMIISNGAISGEQSNQAKAQCNVECLLIYFKIVLSHIIQTKRRC